MRALVGYGTFSDRAKWRSSSSACQSVFEKYLTQPTLSERDFAEKFENRLLGPTIFNKIIRTPGVSAHKIKPCGFHARNVIPVQPSPQAASSRRGLVWKLAPECSGNFEWT